MLLIRVELWSARTGQRKELGCAAIANVGGSIKRGRYHVRLARTFDRLRAGKVWREAHVDGFPRRSLGAWDLLLRALLATVADRNRNAINEVCRSGTRTEGQDGAGEGGRDGDVPSSV